MVAAGQVLPVSSVLARPLQALLPETIELPKSVGTSGDCSPRKILVPVKAVKQQSLQTILALFPRERFHLCALSVIDLSELTGGLPAMSAGNFLTRRAQVFALERERLAAFGQPFEKAGHKVELVVRSGPVRTVLPRVASELGVDLLIMDRWRPGFLLKSVTQALAEQAPCPVLLLNS